MQVVIDIPEEQYNTIKSNLYDTFPAEMKEWGLEAIKNGTPLQSCEDVAKAFQIGIAFGFGEKHDEMNKVIDEIKKVITPQPKTSHWISLDDFRGKYNENGFMCSECNKHSDYEENFCPNCGAKMVEPQESEAMVKNE
jgi:hypothetical protein